MFNLRENNKFILCNNPSSGYLSSVNPCLRKICVMFLWLVAASLQTTGVRGIKWIGVYRLPRDTDHPTDSTADRFTLAECQKASSDLGFGRRQTKFCRHPHYGYAMLAVLRAAHAVGYHCPETFNDRRWNCSSIRMLPKVSPELWRGTREQALVHAFSSAALLFEVGRYCALNKIRHCSCEDKSSAYPLSPPTMESAVDDPDMKSDDALIYSSIQQGSESDEVNMGHVGSYSSTSSQPTVSRFYWAGCSDNFRVAREYTAAFLGFPNIPPTALDMNVFDDVQKSLNRRVKRDLSNPTGETSQDQADRIRRNPPYQWPYAYQRTGSQLNIPYTGQQYRPPYRPHLYNPQSIPNKYLTQHLIKRPRKSKIVRLMNKHNYLVGVVLMEANYKLVCKCHGVSGTCTHRVCFRQLRRIDNEIMQKTLKARYLTAKQVTLAPNRQLNARTFTGNGYVNEVVRPSELVFSEHSPDYCNVEPLRGSVGTQGRLCTLEDSGTANCLNMCCGRGFNNVTEYEQTRCNCRREGFDVKCDECREKMIRHVCL